jgi:hypothetical protein
VIERVLICGSRDFTDKAIFDQAMEKWVARHGMPNYVIEGCARGADRLAERWQLYTNNRGHGVNIRHFPADWDKYGKAAGPIRNKQMLDEGKPQAVIAFSYDLARSRGTANMVAQARDAGLPVWLPLPQAPQ